MGKPFVYMFQYLKGYYLFDINKNLIVEVTKGLYMALGDMCNSGNKIAMSNYSPSVVASLNALESRGFLSSNKPKETLNPLSLVSYDHLTYNLKGMVFQLSQNCNLKCRYCIFSGETILSRGHSNKNMTWEIAKKSIDFFATHSWFSEEVSFGFYGGEPLMAFDILKKSVEYIKEKMYDKTIHFQITTNGTLLTPKCIDFFKENDFDITVSLDGPEKIHNLNRRFSHNGQGSHSIIINHLKEFRDRYPNYYEQKVSYNSVVSDNDNWNVITDYFEKEKLFASNSVTLNNVSDTYLFASYRTSDRYMQKKTIEFHVLLGLVFNYKTNYYGTISNEVNRLKKQFTEMAPLPYYAHHQGPCMPGYRRLFVDIYGNLRVCEKTGEKSGHMIIGNLDSGFDFNAVNRLLNIGKISRDKCLSCRAIRHCRICPVEIDGINELSQELKESLCDYNLANFTYDLKQYVIYRKLGLI